MNGLVTRIITITLLIISLFFSPLALAVGPDLPGSVEPGVLSKTLSAPPIEPLTPKPAPIPKEKEAPQSALGPQAAEIKFRLTKIILEGNVVYSEKDLLPLYRDKLDKTISILELEGIVQSITNYYRNNGYILSRAILPPQHVTNGVVHIRVIEGFIDDVRVAGDPKGAKYIIMQYGNKIAIERPTQVKTMEYYLRLANEIPGASVRAVLEPSKDNIGASDLNLVTEQKTISGYASYDDYGTLYIGPLQMTGHLDANSIFRSGDSTHLTYITTTRKKELKYVDLSNDTPLGSSGLRGSLGANNSRTQPGFTLASSEVKGNSTTIYGLLSYPAIRSRTKDLTLVAGANYNNSFVSDVTGTLYNDHLRPLKIGLNFNNADSFNGSNLFSAFLERGINIFGASTNPNSTTLSRQGADGIYTKFNMNAGRLQKLFWRLSTFIYATGQYSWNPLLATAQFAWGGSQLGRGYDPAELIGDRGAGGSVELRLDAAPGWFLLQTLQPYLYYDAGVIWNLKNVSGINTKSSATSTGFGVRFYFTKNLSGNFMFTQPLTKQVAAEEILGRGRKPRTFFSLVASV